VYDDCVDHNDELVEFFDLVADGSHCGENFQSVTSNDWMDA
jgi:hypothetical protein